MDPTADRTNTSFHARVRALRQGGSSTPGTLIIGVLTHEKTSEGEFDENDILWFQCDDRDKVETITQQYILHFPHLEEIAFQYNGVVLDGSFPLAQLKLFGDNFISIEASLKSELRFNESTPPQEPPQPISAVKSEVESEEKAASIKDETLDQVSGVEGSTTLLSSMALVIDSSKTESSSQHADLKRTILPNKSPAMTVPKFVMECAMRDFIHERLADLCQGSCSRPVEMIENYRTIAVNEWQRMPADTREVYKRRVSNFIKASLNQSNIPAEELDAFTKENAGFYEFVFSKKAAQVARVNSHGSDKAFHLIKAEWDLLSEIYHKFWITAGEKLRHTALHPTTPSSISSKLDCGVSQSKDQFSLQNLFVNASPEILEAAVKTGVQLLGYLKETLLREQSADATQWVQSIGNVQKQAKQPKTIIGVVGNTGAGKSSIINALLDEERLVPTNCMRACTAVVTEISYNSTEVPYRADIEFIALQDWEREVNILFQELIDYSGKICREATNEDTEAGIAYAKIKAVYPKYTKEMLQNSSVQELMSHPDVQNVLGTKKEIAESDSLRFYKQLQAIIDSKEKTIDGEKDKGKRLPKEMELWPLIKVVRLYAKAAPLATGAVIVDLPGVHDSNAARSAVAERYIKECTGLWIVAPITRAVDDKAAKFLLGQTFKRQLQMDGGLNSVTFIGSKTDDISIPECEESLHLEEMEVLYAKSEESENDKQELKKRLAELRGKKADFANSRDKSDRQLEIWEALRDQIDDGKKAFAPPAPSHLKKRKRGRTSARRPPKKSTLADRYPDSDFTDDEDGEDTEDGLDYEQDEPQSRANPLTREQVDEKILDLKNLRQDARRQNLDIEEEMRGIRERLYEIASEKEQMQARVNAIAISSRNEYSRQAIRQDFAAGIKELDQERAEEDDAANFNPDTETRDYEEVARSLPVFCVSSRGYQKLQGHLKKEVAVSGFQTIEETEVPQLQAHCRKLTEAGRAVTSRRFLNSLGQLLNSLQLWSSVDNDGPHLTESQKARDGGIVRNTLEELDIDVQKHIKRVYQQILKDYEDNIFAAFGNAISTAAHEANKTVIRWNSPVNREIPANGGYAYPTYKAICRRKGVFTNRTGSHDWNADLIEPVLRAISGGWENAFSQRIPSILKVMASEAAKSMETFHNNVEARTSGEGRAPGRLEILSNQLRNYQDLLKDICTTTSTMVIEQAKDINRRFQPAIGDALKDTYKICNEENGKGSFMRMKAAMASNVDGIRWKMFSRSTKRVEKALKETIEWVEKDMLARTKEILASVERDYTSALVGTDSQLSLEQCAVRREIVHIIARSEAIFNQLANMEPGEITSKLEPSGNTEYDLSDGLIAALSPKAMSPTNDQGNLDMVAAQKFESQN